MSLVGYFKERQGEIIERIRKVVEAESPSRDTQGIRAVAELLEAQAKKISGVNSVERILAQGYGEHLLIRAYGSDAKDKKHILLIGHIDTVHPRGSLSQRPWRIDNDKIFAPGIFDMKANCVLLLEVLQGLAESGLQPGAPVTILFTCDEEIGSPTGRALVEREAAHAKVCLVLEPSTPGGKVKTGRKGTGNFTLKAHGVASHAGLDPQKGANAIVEIARQILKLHQLNDFEIGTTVTVTTIKGGTATNVVPAEAECEIDVRFSSMAEAARIENEIRSLKAADERVRLEISGDINRPPLERTAGVAALYEKAKQAAGSLGFELDETQVGGASDGNFVSALGVPVLDGLGIAGDGAHSDHEHILPADIPFRGALLSTLLTMEL